MGWRSLCFPSSEDHLDQLNSNAGAPLSAGTEKTEQHCWGSPRPAGLRMQREAELPLQTPALHVTSISSQPCWDVPQLPGPPSSCLGTASDTRCLPRSPPYPADTSHAGPCATSPLLIIGKAGVQPAVGCGMCPGVREEVPGETSLLGVQWPCLGGAPICAGSAPGALQGPDPSGRPLLSRIWGRGCVPALLPLAHWQGQGLHGCQGQAVMPWHS